MGKIKELFTKAQERRMEETGCSFNDAAEWVEQQSVEFLIDYTDVWKKVDEEEDYKRMNNIEKIKSKNSCTACNELNSLKNAEIETIYYIDGYFHPETEMIIKYCPVCGKKLN